VAVRTAVASAVAGAIALVVHGVAGGALMPDPASAGRAGIPTLVGIIAVVTVVFSGGFVMAALALRIAELRSIVAIMVDALRRPRRQA
jgi:hypothetical protein